MDEALRERNAFAHRRAPFPHQPRRRRRHRHAGPAMRSLFDDIGQVGTRGREIFTDGAERKGFLAAIRNAGHVDLRLAMRKADGTTFRPRSRRGGRWDGKPAIIAGIFASPRSSRPRQIARQREAPIAKLTALGSLLAGVAHSSTALGRARPVGMLRDMASDPAISARAERIHAP
jgi:hypothetical protein